MNRFVIDSWAWIEYLKGSSKGLRIRKEIENGAELLTNSVSVAEIISKIKREGMDIEIAWSALTSLSKIVPCDEDFSKNAGLTHAEIKKKVLNFSLGDAFVLYTARKFNAKILTGDPDFSNIKEAELL